MKRNTS
jgi:hypothetical protein